MDGTAIPPNADGTYTIKGDRPLQIRRHVAAVDKFLSDNERTLLEEDHGNEVGRKLHDIGQGNEQMLIIAAEIERQPTPSIVAERIYSWLKGWLNPLNQEVPVYVFNAIHAILNDQFGHLNSEQREAVTQMAADIMAAGDGNNTIDKDYARKIVDDNRWSIAQMLEWVGLGGDGLRERLDFNPDTGEPWSDED